MERKDTVEKVKKSLEHTLSMYLMSATGLQHLNQQIETPMDFMGLHELNAKLENELRETLTSGFLDNILSNEDQTDMLLNYINDIKKMRGAMMSFIRHVNK